MSVNVSSCLAFLDALHGCVHRVDISRASICQEPLDDKVRRLTATLRQQQAEAAQLDAAIAANLKELGF